MACDVFFYFVFIWRFRRALDRVEGTRAFEISSEYERLQKTEQLVLSLLNGATEERMKIFASKFSQIPMDVMTSLKEDNILGQQIVEEYRRLCREALPHSWTRPSASGRCYYRVTSAYSKLSPQRLEMLHEAPDVIIFHDVISPARAERLMSLSGDKLVRRRQ